MIRRTREAGTLLTRRSAIAALAAATVLDRGRALAGTTAMGAGGPMPAPGQILGRTGAPVFEQVFSWTCSHCADFHTHAFGEIRRRFIDTGKIRWIFTDLPADRPSLAIAAIARAVDMPRRMELTDRLMTNQKAWMTAPDPLAAAIELAAKAGIDPKFAEHAARDPLAKQTVIEQAARVMRRGISSTPALIEETRAMNPGLTPTPARQTMGVYNGVTLDSAVHIITLATA